jgi:Arc/MetJ-type ribon-helix-helix transcriptional regulator
MRNIMTISVPPSVKKSVDHMMKENKYASVSELFRDSIRSLEEDQLIKNIEESEREFAKGQGKVLRALKDLM